MIWMGKHIPLKETIKLQQWTICAGSVVRNPLTNAGDTDSIPGSGRFTGEGNGKPLQYSCLENLIDRGAWQATVHGIIRVGHDLATKKREIAEVGATEA